MPKAHSISGSSRLDVRPSCPVNFHHPLHSYLRTLNLSRLFSLSDLDAATTDGVVYVVSPQGKEVATILVEGSEISGLAIR